MTKSAMHRFLQLQCRRPALDHATCVHPNHTPGEPEELQEAEKNTGLNAVATKRTTQTDTVFKKKKGG